MKAKHTPGPWIVDDDDKTNYDRWRINVEKPTSGNPANNVIAEIPAIGGNTEADARLIAAAPELLEALKALVSVYMHDDSNVADALDAIAKAEGGKP